MTERCCVNCRNIPCIPRDKYPCATHTHAAPATFEQCRLSSVCVDVRIARNDEREQAAKRVDAFAGSLHDLESIVIKGGLRELAESLRGGA